MNITVHCTLGEKPTRKIRYAGLAHSSVVCRGCAVLKYPHMEMQRRGRARVLRLRRAHRLWGHFHQVQVIQGLISVLCWWVNQQRVHLHNTCGHLLRHLATLLQSIHLSRRAPALGCREHFSEQVQQKKRRTLKEASLALLNPVTVTAD